MKTNEEWFDGRRNYLKEFLNIENEIGGAATTTTTITTLDLACVFVNHTIQP